MSERNVTRAGDDLERFIWDEDDLILVDGIEADKARADEYRERMRSDDRTAPGAIPPRD